MEYLVNMTTHVPDGTSAQAVDEIRVRESDRSRQLVAQKHLLRLWRPPLQPGEWRTFGLFAADDAGQLKEVLTSMPLRVWRTDEVTPLSLHANDPAHRTDLRASPAPTADGTEYFTTFTLTVPTDTAAEIVDAANEREAERTRELAEQGHLLRLWVLPGDGRALGLWTAHDTGEIQAILESLPLNAWLSVQTTKLSPHPSDPGTQ